MKRTCWIITWLCAIGTLAPLCAGADPDDRLWALFRDGTTHEAPSAEEVTAPSAQPRVNGKAVFDPARPIRLVRNLEVAPQLRGPHVVTANGDILPGSVVAFAAADPAAGLPDRLIVVMQPGIVSGQRALRRPAGHRGEKSERQEDRYETQIRVDRVARITWGRAGNAASVPGTLVLADGRSIPFSSLRWTAEGAKTLGEDGIALHKWSELVEFQAPSAPALEALLEDNVAPCPDERLPVGRVTLANGAQLTFRCWSIGAPWRKGGPGVWSIQPAWALSGLTFGADQISHVSARTSDELPLSLLPARTLAQQGLMGFAWAWQPNRSVRGEPLSAGGMHADLGIGAHSFSRIAFELPPKAQSLEAWVGLDRAVGEGGCAVCKVYLDEAGGPAWTSGHLRGGQAPARVGPLSVAAARQVILQTDYGHEGRPVGADPWDIRDEVDWLSPVVKIDRASLPGVEATARRHLPCLADWTVPAATWPSMRLTRRWDSGLHRWEPAMLVESAMVVLDRTVAAPASPWCVEVALGREEKQPSPQVELLMNGAAASAEHGLTARRQVDVARGVPATRWQFAPTLTGPVRLSLRIAQDPKASKTAPLLLRGLAIGPTIEGLDLGRKLPSPAVWLSAIEPLKQAVAHKTKFSRDGAGTKPLELAGLRWDRWVTAQSISNLSYSIPPGQKRFVGVVGSMGDEMTEVEVLIDDQVAWRARGIVEPRPRLVEVTLPAGAAKLTLRMPVGPVVAWANAGFLSE